MNDSIQLTPAQKQELANFHASLTRDETVYLDPSDPLHLGVIQIANEASGRTAAKYPYLFAVINSGAPYTGKQLDIATMVDAGETEEGKATATVWLTSEGDNLISGGTTFVIGPAQTEILAFGDNAGVSAGFLTNPTLSQNSVTVDGEPTIDILHLAYVMDPKGITRFTAYANSIVMTTGAGDQATIAAPIISHDEHENIEIAVGRTQGQPINDNADYIYVEPEDEGASPYLISPFVGQWVLNGTPDLTKLSAADLVTYVVVQSNDKKAEHLTRATEFTTDEKMLAAFSSERNILKWDFPFDGSGSGDKGYRDTNSIVYKPGSLTSEQRSYFFFSMTIQFEEGDPVTYNVCSKNSPETPSINCKTIDNLMYYWHCAAAGTQVTLEDGTEALIESLDTSSRVKTGIDGLESLAVYATVKGSHQSTSSQAGCQGIYQLQAENSKSVTASGCHIIFMEDMSCRMISDIAVDEVVMTDSGPSKVTQNDPIDHSGMFYGLVLGSKEERAREDFPVNMARFYAGGILTGDHHAMQYHCSKCYKDLDYMLPRIQQDMKTDYTSAAAAVRY